MELEKFNNGHGLRLVLSDEESAAAKLVHNYLPPEEEELRKDKIAQAEAIIKDAAADLARRYPDVKKNVVLGLARTLPEFPNPEHTWVRTDGAATLYYAFSKERKAMKADIQRGEA